MDQWLNENLLVFLLAGFSGFDILKRSWGRVQSAIVDLPLKCRKKITSGVKYAEAEF